MRCWHVSCLQNLSGAVPLQRVESPVWEHRGGLQGSTGRIMRGDAEAARGSYRWLWIMTSQRVLLLQHKPQGLIDPGEVAWAKGVWCWKPPNTRWPQVTSLMCPGASEGLCCNQSDIISVFSEICNKNSQRNFYVTNYRHGRFTTRLRS